MRDLEEGKRKQREDERKSEVCMYKGIEREGERNRKRNKRRESKKKEKGSRERTKE